MRHSFSILAIVSACAAASAQTINWIPGFDVPPSTFNPPDVNNACMWDRDGAGPLLPVIVAGGELFPVNMPNGRYVAMRDSEGWHGIAPEPFTHEVIDVAVYRPPGALHDYLFASAYTDGLFYTTDGTAWTRITAAASSGILLVADLDGDGPEPAKLIVGNNGGVTVWDGTNAVSLGGGNFTSVAAMYVWDADGPGGNPPELLVAKPFGDIYSWTGSQWVLRFQTNAGVDSMIAFDFDGPGPDPAELVIGGMFFSPGGRLAKLHNGSWVSINATCNCQPEYGHVHSMISYDPDGPGPMPLRLLIAGDFSFVDGVAARNYAYYEAGDTSWHSLTLSPYTIGSSLSINNYPAEYSNSTQILATHSSRPVVTVLAMSDGLPSIVQQPATWRGPVGAIATMYAVPAGDELTFQWLKGTTPITNGPTTSGSVISGALTPRLTITNVAATDSATYRLRVSNAAGMVNSRSVVISIGCAANFNGDSAVDFFDYLDFVDAFSARTPEADFNHDGVFDFFDYLDFVDAFANGC